jgi:hypothetical protein
VTLEAPTGRKIRGIVRKWRNRECIKKKIQLKEDSTGRGYNELSME